MASLQRAVAHLPSYGGVSHSCFGHAVDASQSLSPISYYVNTVPSQHSSCYADRRTVLCAKIALTHPAI